MSRLPWHKKQPGKELEVPSGQDDSGSSGQPEVPNVAVKEPQRLEEYGLNILHDLPRDQTNALDIVAVHGLGGHWQRTWTDSHSGNNWLEDFLPAQLKDQRLESRVMSYGYDSGGILSKAVSDIRDVARELLNCLNNGRQSTAEKARPVLFIAHSMGGVVVKQIARKPLVRHDAASTKEAASTPIQGRLPTTVSHTTKAGMFEYHLHIADRWQALFAGRTQWVSGNRNSRIPQTGSDIKIFEFSEPYPEPPRVLIGITYLDVDFRQALRAHASVSEVTPLSFRSVLEIWADTIRYGISGSWLEIAPGDSDIQTGRCNTHGLDKHWHVAKDMEIIRDVNFYKSYAEVPGVICYLVHIDSLQLTNHRMHVDPQNITRTGFELHFTSWGDSHIFELEAEWIAFSKDRMDIHAFPEEHVMDPRPRKDIMFPFPAKNFERPPACFVAFSHLEIISGENVRVKVLVQDVGKASASMSVDTWGDSENYAIGVTGLAIL